MDLDLESESFFLTCRIDLESHANVVAECRNEEVINVTDMKVINKQVKELKY